ncbi:MAG: hypothetical protein VX737_04285 [Pseudomonadota bacterium]|nr:hypothetical protein [Pseudomonadota bacterium]
MTKIDPSKLFINIKDLKSDLKSLSTHIMNTLELSKDLGFPELRSLDLSKIGAKSRIYRDYTKNIQNSFNATQKFIGYLDLDSLEFNQAESKKLLSEFSQYRRSILDTLKKYDTSQHLIALSYHQKPHLQEILDATNALQEKVMQHDFKHSLPKISYFNAALAVGAAWVLGNLFSRGP